MCSLPAVLFSLTHLRARLYLSRSVTIPFPVIIFTMLTIQPIQIRDLTFPPHLLSISFRLIACCFRMVLFFPVGHHFLQARAPLIVRVISDSISITHPSVGVIS